MVYKIKEVCKMTGLTDRAVRLYMEQGLVEPEIREGIHNKAYFFSDENIERLKDIATLRSAGFSLADIKLMLENPANISALVGEREALLAIEVDRMRNIQETLNHLTIQEHNDVTKLADAITPRSIYAKETPRVRMPQGKKAFLWAVVITAIVLLFGLTDREILLVLLFALGITGGFFCIGMSAGYFRYGYLKKSGLKRTSGKVTAIISGEGIEEYIGKSKYATLREIVTTGLFHWNDIRPDHWFPLIQFQKEDGELCISTFRYGGLKNWWTVGETIDVFWEEDKLIYPCSVKWLQKKIACYLTVGIVLLGLAFVAWRLKI